MKKSEKREGPYPVQLGRLRTPLQTHAYQIHKRSLHWLILEILDEYAFANGLVKEKREINFGKEKNDNAGI